MVKKLLFILIALMIVLVGCSSNEAQTETGDRAAEENETVTLNFWKPPHGTDEEVYAELIAEFQKENPNIKVTHTIIPWGSVDQQFATAFAGSNPPDVVYMPDEWFPRYANDGALLDLTERFKEISSGWNEDIAKLGQYKGVQYGVPHIVATQAFFYNKKLLEEAGYSEPPKTLEEMKTIASKITEESANVYGLKDRMAGFSVQFWGPLFQSAGVELLNDDLTKATFNTPEAVEVLDYIKELYDSGAVVPRNRFDEQQQQEMTISEKIGMSYENYDGIAAYKRENPDLDLAVVLPPANSKGKVSQAAFYGFMFVSEQSKHKEEAWEFVKFLTNAENLESYAQTVSMFSTRNDSTWWKDDPLAVPFAKALENSFGAIPTVHWREICRIIGGEIDYVIADRKSSQEALNDAESAINEILDGN